jgi:abortive infection bacteriophage resistance protein
VNYNKPATTLEQQIGLLEKRGMHVPDRERAAHYLRHIGYYRLSAYWLPFEQSNSRVDARSHQFISGTAFDDVLDRYVFDRKLRMLALEALERIEISVRACWVNTFSLRHGVHAYLDARYFKCPYWHASQLARVAADLKNSNEVFVEHYRRKYTSPGLPPMWVMAETLSFGALSGWVQKTRDTGIQTELMRHLNLPTMEIVHGVSHNLSYLRNLCAHHARLWNRQFVKTYPRIKKIPGMYPPETPDGKYRSVSNHFVMLRHLILQINPKTSWPDRLIEVLDSQDGDTRSAMHLPEDWRKFLEVDPEQGNPK